jgi:KDO2-lipid IV(A) lauroyltransferase
MRLKDRTLYALLYGISLLPLGFLYMVSDMLSFIVFNFIGYRKKIVLSNLKIAFPEKVKEERNRIAKQFYKNFTDTLVESIKLISADEKFIKRMFVGNVDGLNAMAEKGKNIQIHAMHNFNWEVVNLGVSRLLKKPFLAVYQPIANTFFENIFSTIRSRYGTRLIPANDFKNNFIKYDNEQYLIALVADQNPGNPAKAWWLNFFGKPAPFVMGPEKAARERNTMVVFANFFKVKRGVYSFETELITEDLSLLPEGELTKRYLKYIEARISERPDNYLWSHRRWKHQYKDAYADSCLEKLNLS